MVEGTGSAAGGGGTGTAAAGGTAAGGTTGGGSDAGGTGGVGAGTNAGDPSRLDREKLNPLLRGMSEEQVNEVFDTLFTAAKRGPDSGIPAHARTVETPPAPKPVTKDELREAFDPNSDKFDPQAAIDRIVTQNYGGLLTDISGRANMGMKVALRDKFPDIDQYEDNINTVLGGRPAQNEKEYIGAYLMAKGARQVETEIETRKTAARPRTVTPSPQEDRDAQNLADQDKLSDAEMDVAKIMFRHSKDPVAEFKRTAALARDFKIKVPGDKP